MAQGRSKKLPPPGHDIQVPVDWRPRPYQNACWNAFAQDGVKRGVCVWHRRAGKDHLAINLCAVSMFKRPGIYWHVLPTYTQGKKAIWNGMDNDGRKFIDYIPKEAAMRRRNDDMIIEFEEALGGSIYQVIGGDNPDRIVGGNPIGVVFSEYSLMNPEAWNLIRPILNANDGWALFIFTPRGYNHGWDMMQRAQESENWFTETLDITKTFRHDGKPVITMAQYEEEIAMGMPEELARQEFLCDFSAPLVGAYFGKEMDLADSEGRVSPDVIWRKDLPVSTCWDLGVRDTMVVWFYQVVDDWVNFIDYHAASSSGIDDFARLLDRKPYVYKAHYAPHDVAKREVGYGKSIIATAADLGLRFTRVPRTKNLDDDINAVRIMLGRSRFNSEKCEHGIKALRHYSRKWDRENKVWSLRPDHNWSSHCFVGDTKVWTRSGTCRIMDLPEKGEVLTLCGWKQYRNPRMSKRDAPLVEVAFSDGTTVRCTPDHLFLTENGWISSSNLVMGSSIQSSLTPLRSILMGVSTEFLPMKNISKIRNICTEMCGRVRSVLSQRSAISTTGMVFDPTISCLTLSVSRRASTTAWRLGGGSNQEISLGDHPRRHERPPQNGIGVRRDGSGTAGRPSGRKAGRSGGGKISLVNIVERWSRCLLEKMAGIRDFVAMSAKPLRIESVRGLSEKADVWDITVPGVEHFSLANGAIVHNSVDAIRTGATVMPRLVVSLKEAAKYPGDETWDELMSDHDDIIASEGCKSSFRRI